MREASTEQIGGGGVSIYYSQILQVLFFSYAQGITFMASLTKIEEEALNQCITQVKFDKFCFCLFLTEEIQYHDSLRSRELGQAPILLCGPNS